jgi:hypothetical protein
MLFRAPLQLAFALGLTRQCYAQTATEAGCDFKYLTQQLDHFGESNETFQQRYSMFPEFFKRGGPILFFQGEEGILDCAVRRPNTSQLSPAWHLSSVGL